MNPVSARCTSPVQALCHSHAYYAQVLTFPTEGRMASDLSFAEQVFRAVVRRTLACGTTTAAYYGTLHLEPCKMLVDIVEQLGQRAIVGKVGGPRAVGCMGQTFGRSAGLRGPAGYSVAALEGPGRRALYASSEMCVFGAAELGCLTS